MSNDHDLHVNRLASIDSLRREFDFALEAYRDIASRVQKAAEADGSVPDARLAREAIRAYDIMRVSSDALATLLRKI